jgi:hypothetical protein
MLPKTTKATKTTKTTKVIKAIKGIKITRLKGFIQKKNTKVEMECLQLFGGQVYGIFFTP